jgi:flavodoxin
MRRRPAAGSSEVNPVSRTLLVFYSLGGHTHPVARAIAERSGAVLEAIAEPRPRRGFSGLLRIAWEIIARRPVELLPAEHDPADLDTVVIGAPVWAGTVPTPVRSYIRAHAAALQRVAFFCTEDGSGGERAFERMQALCAAESVATLIATQGRPDSSVAAALESILAAWQGAVAGRWWRYRAETATRRGPESAEPEGVTPAKAALRRCEA